MVMPIGQSGGDNVLVELQTTQICQHDNQDQCHNCFHWMGKAMCLSPLKPEVSKLLSAILLESRCLGSLCYKLRRAVAFSCSKMDPRIDFEMTAQIERQRELLCLWDLVFLF